MHATFEVSEVVATDPSITPAAQDRAQRKADEERDGHRVQTPAFAGDDPDESEIRVVLYPHPGEDDDVAIAAPARNIEIILPADEVGEDLLPGTVVKVSLSFEVLNEGTARSWAVGGPGVNAQGDPRDEATDAEAAGSEPRNSGNAPIHSPRHAGRAGSVRREGETDEQLDERERAEAADRSAAEGRARTAATTTTGQAGKPKVPKQQRNTPKVTGAGSKGLASMAESNPS